MFPPHREDVLICHQMVTEYLTKKDLMAYLKISRQTILDQLAMHSLTKEDLPVRDFVHHPEGQDKVDWSLESKFIGFAWMNSDSIGNPRPFSPSDQRTQHLRLYIRSNHPAFVSHELVQIRPMDRLIHYGQEITTQFSFSECAAFRLRQTKFN